MLLVIGVRADPIDLFLFNCSSSLTRLGQGRFYPFVLSASRVKEDVTGSVNCVMLRYKMFSFSPEMFELFSLIFRFIVAVFHALLVK